MKRLSLLLVGFLSVSSLLRADIITMKDGTKVEGEIRRSGDNYIVKDAAGHLSTVPVEKVAGIEVHPQTGADPAMSRLQSLRRAADNMPDIKQIVDRYRTFIDQNAKTPASDAAQQDLNTWLDRQEHGMVKVGDKWMTTADRDALLGKSTDIAISLHDMLKAGRLKEATPILDRSLQVDPKNISLLYLHGVLTYQQETLPAARKAFEAILAPAPDHAPTLNNLGVILWRQHAPAAAMGYYDRAMLAAPASRDILDNVAEALNALPKEQRESAVVKKVVRHFKEQDDTLQKKMADAGMYRWGGTWLNEKELKKLKDDEKAVKDQLTQMQADFDTIQQRIAAIDRNLTEITNELNLIDAQTYQQGPNGQVIRLPYPAIYFTLGQQADKLKGERATRVDALDNLRKAAKQAQQHLPAPKYTGIQKIIDADGMPLPAGAHPPLPAGAPGSGPAAPAPGPAPAAPPVDKRVPL